MEKKENGLLVNEFDGERICIDKENSYPEYLKNYLYGYGIMLSPDGKYFYNDGIYGMKEVYTRMDDEDIVFYIPGGNTGYIAKIKPNNNVYFMKGVNGASSIHMFEDGSGFCYANQGTVCNLWIETDALGNVFVIIGVYGKEYEKVSILVGTEHKKPEEYIDDLKTQFNENPDNLTYSEKDRRLIHTMIDDPRILKTIAKLMERMEELGSSVDEVKENLIKSYKDKYIEEIGALIAALNESYLPRINDVIACANKTKERLEQLEENGVYLSVESGKGEGVK